MVCRALGFIGGAPVTDPRVRNGCARAAETDMRANTSSTHKHTYESENIVRRKVNLTVNRRTFLDK